MHRMTKVPYYLSWKNDTGINHNTENTVAIDSSPSMQVFKTTGGL